MNEFFTCIAGFFGVPAVILLIHYMPRTSGILVFTGLAYLAWTTAHRGDALLSALVLAIGVWFVVVQFRMHRRFYVPTRGATES